MNTMMRARNALAAFGLNQVGRLLVRRGVHRAAAWCFEEALRLSPGAANGVFELAKSRWLDQDFTESRRLLEQLLVSSPRHAKALNLLGVMDMAEGRLDAAEDKYQQAIALEPDWAAPHNNLGNVFLAHNDFAAAEKCFRRALECDSEYVEALCNLAPLLNRTGRFEEAERVGREAIRLKPDFAGAINNLGSILLNLGRFAEGVEQFRSALELQPDLVEAQVNLALCVDEPGRLVVAMEHFQRVLERDPHSYLALLRLTQGCLAQREHDKAEDYVQRVLELKPDALDALTLLGSVAAGQGLNRKVLELNRKALENGAGLGVGTSFIFHSLYDDATDAQRLFEISRDWAKRYVEGPDYVVPDFSGYTQSTQLQRKLRIGYVSKDFGLHSVSFFLEPILANHDRQNFEIYCYACLFHPDAVTERFKTYADVWREIPLVNHTDLVKMVCDDEIDILLDLSGHTTGGKLGLFARKPAPVQINYLGYPATTGVAAMDYRLVDAITDPPGADDAFHSEKLWRLPGCFLTYQPPKSAADVAHSPCLQNGYITFGSFNNALKVTETVVEVWARILRQVPDSRLMLKSLTFASERGKAYFQSLFAEQGIEAGRVELFSWHPEVAGHLELYAKIDIALDPFPYNGTTTTCEALWMGVPVITLAGERHSARVGASLLTQLGMAELVADSKDEYVRLAVELAGDTARIENLRAGLRGRMRQSPLLDHVGFTRNLEAAYREMWRLAAERIDAARQQAGDAGDAPARLAAQPDAVAKPTADEAVRLHIGGLETKPGWKIFNITPGPNVDHVGDIADLSGFDSHSVDEIYGSHVLEHVDLAAMPGVLSGMRRVLKPGGKLMISVPDMEVLCEHYLAFKSDKRKRHHVMRMIFGGQTDPHDYHYIGLDFDLLADLLREAGFRDVQRVEKFELFSDASTYAPYGKLISLNVVAVK